MTDPVSGGTASDELPGQFPVFPLPGALLLPHLHLPLNIFEPRYLAMVEDALGGSRHIGMIQPNPALPRGPNGPGLHRVGCLGRLVSFAETDDGRFLITLRGITRFHVVEELGMTRGYRRVAGDFTAFAADPGQAEPVAIDRHELFDLLREYFARRGAEINWDALQDMSDTSLVATLAIACPFEPLEKQALLEAPDETERAITLLTLLRFESLAGDRKPGRMS